MPNELRHLPTLHLPAWSGASLRAMPLAQSSPWDDTPAPSAPATPPRPMSFSDLQHSMHAVQTGEIKDNGFRKGTPSLLAVIARSALILHLRQRHKTAGPPDSLTTLSWELSRQIRFPWGTRFML